MTNLPLSAAASRPIRRLVRGQAASDGAGVRLTRLLGHETVELADPFLMLDHFDTEDAADYIGGFPEHPHRGFETVTYMLAGRMRHGDNKGHSGVIASGDVQWMTAGSGIIHSEMPEQEQGLMRGFQLWVNLPARDKMVPARYQEIPAASIPVEARDGSTLKVVAGMTGQGTAGPIVSGATAARFFDIRLQPGARLEEALPGDLTAVAVVYDGVIRIVGRPLNEPVAWGGPFVMNTREEVMQAARDYQAGRF